MAKKKKRKSDDRIDSRELWGAPVALRGRCDICGRTGLDRVYGVRLKSDYDPGHADICIECYACLNAEYMSGDFAAMIDKKLPGLGRLWRERKDDGKGVQGKEPCARV